MERHLSFDAISDLIDEIDCVIVFDDGAGDTDRLRRDAMCLRLVLPVVVVQQPDAKWPGDAVPAGVECYPVPLPLDSVAAASFAEFLALRSLGRLLLWFSDPVAGASLAAAWPDTLRVMRPGGVESRFSYARERYIACADLVIVDDEATAARTRLEFGDGISVVVVADDMTDPQATLARPIALSDGGMGVPLAPEIVHSLSHRLPWWDFHVVGGGNRVGAEWQFLRDHPNVRDRGELDDAALASMAQGAAAILLPCAASSDLDAAAAVRFELLLASGVPLIVSPALGQAAGVTVATSLDEFEDILRRIWAFGNLARPGLGYTWLERVAHMVTGRLRTSSKPCVRTSPPVNVPPVVEGSLGNRLRWRMRRVFSTGMAQLRPLLGRALLRLMRIRAFVTLFRPLWRLLPARLRATLVSLLWG
ncbi:protein of unknown function [Burkholderia multivorans]